MNIDRLVLRFAGSFILVTLLLSQIHSLKWLWLTAFVGANLLQASFTGFCPVVKLLKSVGYQDWGSIQMMGIGPSFSSEHY